MGIATADLERPPPMKVRPAWRRRPTRAHIATALQTEELLNEFDNYFSEQYDQGGMPTLCDMAGSAGFDSVTQMVNHARRNGGALMRGISRGTLAVAAGYEELALEGNRNALTLLGLVPQFDSNEPAEQKPQRPFLPQQEINLNIAGVTRSQTQGAQLTEQEAYLQLIKHKTYEEISSKVIDVKKDADGDYSVLTLAENE